MGIVDPASEQSAFIQIPKARVGALIGEAGRTKAQLEKELVCHITADEEGGVEIKCADPLVLLKAKSMVQAIGRGFSVESAMLLLDDAYILDIINLQEEVGKSERALIRYRSRLIGTEGKARKKIEQATETQIAIQGKTVAIIGRAASVQAAKRAISMILGGATHGAVFNMLTRMKKGARED